MSLAPDSDRLMLTVVDPERLRRVLVEVLDEERMLSPHGIRSLSKRHAAEPFWVELDGQEFSVGYEPAESRTALYGGNSNWRGPVWMPINYLVIEGLERYHQYLGEAFTVECPTGSGQHLNLSEVAEELRRRLVSLFLPDASGARPADGAGLRADPGWDAGPLFYEYFDGDTGAGLGASHQTGWTALVADLIRGMPTPAGPRGWPLAGTPAPTATSNTA